MGPPPPLPSPWLPPPFPGAPPSACGEGPLGGRKPRAQTGWIVEFELLFSIPDMQLLTPPPASCSWGQQGQGPVAGQRPSVLLSLTCRPAWASESPCQGCIRCELVPGPALGLAGRWRPQAARHAGAHLCTEDPVPSLLGPGCTGALGRSSTGADRAPACLSGRAGGTGPLLSEFAQPGLGVPVGAGGKLSGPR